MPDTTNRSINDIIRDIEKGYIKIPQFQREFIWNKEKSASLIDSILKGYPIGTFIFWKTKEIFRIVRNIGDIHLPETEVGETTQYVLDGQQRITSLFATILGKKIKTFNKIIDFSEIYIDLTSQYDDDIVTTFFTEEKKHVLMKLNTLIYGNFKTLVNYPEVYHPKIVEYQRILNSFQIPVISINNSSIEVATEIFTRINVGGKPLTVFEIMVAKTFDYNKQFDLAKKYDFLIKEKLTKIQYDTISEAVFLRAISIIIKQECSKKAILSINKNILFEIYPKVLNSIEFAIDYFIQNFKILSSDFLPYQDLLVLFSYFFFIHPGRPNYEQNKMLEDLFWRISLTERYTSGTDSKIASDIQKISEIAKQKLPIYDYSPWSILTPEYIEHNGKFSLNHSFIKALLCVLYRNYPRTFDNNAFVDVANFSLKKNNTRNYHHFFPSAYLKSIKVQSYKINHIANITLIDSTLNKQISDKKPSVYIKDLEKRNPELNETLRTHLINIENDDILNDNYEKFFNERIKRIICYIREKIIQQDIDKINTASIELKDQNVFSPDYEQVTLKSRKFFAYGIIMGQSVKILKGSEASATTTDSLNRFWKSERDILISENILIWDGEKYIFAKDHQFSSKSAAASIICGNSRDGNQSFIKKN